MSTGLLEGVRVLDLTRLLPGPLATMHLADQGAEVIKIEDPDKGDYARHDLAPPGRMSPLFHALNRGKRSVVIDLRAPAGREAFLGLVDTADVVVESFRPGVMADLGLSPQTLRARKAALVVCSITAHGQTGPLAGRPAHDNNMVGYAGVAALYPRDADGRIRSPDIQFADVAGGALHAAMAISMALARTARTSEGATLDISMVEAALSAAVLPFALREAFEAGQGPLVGALPGYDYYRCQDGRHMAVGALEPKFWSLFCDAVGRPDLKAAHLAFGPPAESAKAELRTLFATRTRDEWAARLEPLGCCVTPVLSLDEALAHPQLAAREFLYAVSDPQDGEMLRMGAPFRVDGTRARPKTSAPRHGEHTAIYWPGETS